MLLAVDSSTQQIGLALYDGSNVIAEEIWHSQNHHTVELSPAIANLMNRCGVTPRQITSLGVATGPGSFTGLRIGMSVIKGMAFYLHVPVIGVPSLDIIAAAQPVEDYSLAAVLRAGRGRLAVGWYKADAKKKQWIKQGEYQVLEAGELIPKIHALTLICGELTMEERQILGKKKNNIILATPAQSIRRPSYLAEIAWERVQKNAVDDVVSLTPVYLHLSGNKPSQ